MKVSFAARAFTAHKKNSRARKTLAALAERSCETKQLLLIRNRSPRIRHISLPRNGRMNEQGPLLQLIPRDRLSRQQKALLPPEDSLPFGDANA
jgi:hypothetical protein